MFKKTFGFMFRAVALLSGIEALIEAADEYDKGIEKKPATSAELEKNS